MSERNEPGEKEGERTDPSIELPDDGPTLDRTMQVELPEHRSGPPPLPPRPPASPLPRASEAHSAVASPPSSRPAAPPESHVAHAPGRPPASPPSPGAVSESRRASDEKRPPMRTGTLPPPAFRPGTIPPARMPKPSDAPPPRSDLSPPQRQRLAQMESQLDQARSALARQRHEMDELRSRLEAKEERLEELLANLQQAASDDDIEQRFAALETQRDALSEELRKRFGDAEAATGGARFESIETRLSSLEEGTELSRIRMRLERAGHRLDAVDGRIVDLETVQPGFREALERAGRAEPRLERLESLFEEMAQELRDLRDARGDDELRARVADLETLVLETGNNERAIREQLEAQTGQLRRLRESMVPPARAPGASGEDLTRIKGVGPKYATALAEMGATTIAEIAAWGEDDVQRAATTLGIKASRVSKWVRAAQAIGPGGG